MPIKRKRKEEVTEKPTSLKKTAKEIPSDCLSLTREELQQMGISIKSDIVGKFSSLSHEVREAVQQEIAGVMLEKVTKILNSIDDQKIEDTKSIKDLSIAMSIMFDKFRVGINKSTRNVEVKHELTDLVRKNSEANIGNIDYADIIDAEILNVDSIDMNLKKTKPKKTENEVVEEENDDGFEDLGE